MNVTLKLAFSALAVTMFSCAPNNKEKKEPVVVVEKKEEVKELSKGERLINDAITAHGGDLYKTASYEFVFRKKQYSFTNKDGAYTYTVKRVDENGNEVIDSLKNGSLSKFLNGKAVELTAKDQSRYSEALNSVIYFATLPYKLNDGAVNKKFVETQTIKGETYNVVKVTFNKEGGGKDFDDEFYYWIHAKTNTIDYLAYNYKVNNGGVRFRSSYNRRNVGGIIFQDYINYKAEVGTPLKLLPGLYENEKLKELSRIDTENVKQLH